MTDHARTARTLVAIDPFPGLLPAGTGMPHQRFRSRVTTRLENWQRGRLKVNGVERGVYWSPDIVDRVNELAQVQGTEIVYLPRHHIDFQHLVAMTGLGDYDIVQGRELEERRQRLTVLAEGFDRLVLLGSGEPRRHVIGADVVPDVLTVNPSPITGPDLAIMRRVLMFCQDSIRFSAAAPAPHTFAT